MLQLITFDQEVNINGISIQPKKCFAFLGVLVDDHLSFSAHIDYLVKVTLRSMAAIMPT